MVDKDKVVELLFTNGTFDSRRWRNANKIEGLNEMEGSSLSEKVWNVFNERPKCYCGNLTKWSGLGYNVGYRPTCSSRCAQNDKTLQETKAARHVENWSDPEWAAATARRMKESHHRTRTPKKLKLIAERGIVPLTEITADGQAEVYRWRHVCGYEFDKSFKKQELIYCQRCYSSQQQSEIYDYIKTIYDGEVIVNDRTVIKPKEIDIYLPDLKLGFEYNGNYWHQGDGSYEDMKTQLAADSGVNLVQIWENDWKKNRRSATKAMIQRLI